MAIYIVMGGLVALVASGLATVWIRNRRHWRATLEVMNQEAIAELDQLSPDWRERERRSRS